MIVCKKCGRRHPDGADFCECGAFLEFDGERIADPIETLPPATAESGGRPGGSTLSPPPGAEPATAARTAPVSGGSWSGLPGTRGGTGGGTGQIDPRLPDAPTAVASAEPERVVTSHRAGDAQCGVCGTYNAPDLSFCKHCGAPMATGAASFGAEAASVGARPSWWKRLVDRARGNRTPDPRSAMLQGQGLMQGQGMGGGRLALRSRAFRIGGAALGITAILAMVGPWRRPVLDRAQETLRISRFEIVDLEPTDVVTVPIGSELELQEAAKVVDGAINTAWATVWLDPASEGLEAIPEDGSCAADDLAASHLQFTFEEPTDIKRMRIVPGRWAEDETRGLHRRPKIIELRVSGDEEQDADRCLHVVVADEGELITANFEADAVTAVDLRIVAVYADNESSDRVEISEVAFERSR